MRSLFALVSARRYGETSTTAASMNLGLIARVTLTGCRSVPATHSSDDPANLVEAQVRVLDSDANELASVELREACPTATAIARTRSSSWRSSAELTLGTAGPGLRTTPGISQSRC